jgi:magnesium-transporting ATPase (P-type)
MLRKKLVGETTVVKKNRTELLFYISANVILLNNDLSSIPVAVEMGRLVFDNLKKVILYLMPVSSMLNALLF